MSTQQFSILIQGPLDENSLINLDIYKEYGDVIISHWNSDDRSLFNKYDISDCTIISSKIPDNSAPVKIGVSEWVNTFYWAMHSAYNGIRACKSDYIIKIRSDERYSNLQPMIDKILENPEKFITTSIFFKKWDFSHFHVSDHLFGGKTELMRRSWKLICDIWDGKKPQEDWAKQTTKNFAEAIQCKAFLNTLGLECSKEEVYNNFDIVDINQLGEYLIQYKGSSLSWSNEGVEQRWEKDGEGFYPQDSVVNMDMFYGS